MLGLALSGGVQRRHRGPQTGVELAAKLLDQPLLVLGQLDVAFRDQHLTVAGLHPQKAHAADYVTPRMSTGPAPAPTPAQPVADRLRAARCLAVRAASSGESPRASRAASTEEWVQPDPWAAPSG